MDPESLLYREKWRVIDQSALGPSFCAAQSFAIDDTLCASVGKGASSPVARAWVHHHTVVLGIPDARLPFIHEGIEYLQERGYRTVVRNSGGLAVVLDTGILNLSFIFPEISKEKINIDRGYEAVVAFVRRMLSPFEWNIRAQEIPDSYCPGRFDLSVNGKKFAGISQRRVRSGVAVQIYLCAEGSGAERAHIIRSFYSRAAKGQNLKFRYPRIRPSSMASLTELSGQKLDVKALLSLFLLTLQHYGGQLVTAPLTPEEIDAFYVNYKRMLDRNKKALLP